MVEVIIGYVLAVIVSFVSVMLGLYVVGWQHPGDRRVLGVNYKNGRELKESWLQWFDRGWRN